MKPSLSFSHTSGLVKAPRRIVALVAVVASLANSLDVISIEVQIIPALARRNS
jgi:hypothetical protein